MNSHQDIYLFVDSSAFGGIETHILQLAAGLTTCGLHVKVILFKDYGPHPLTKLCKAHSIPVITLRFGAISLLKLLSQSKPALLHSHGYKAGIIGRLAARLLGIACIHTYHAGEACSGKLALYSALDRYSAFLNTKTIAVSAQISQQLKVKNIVLNNFICISNVLPSNGRNIAFVGRLSDEKGPDRFIALAKHNSDLAFHLYGDGPMRSSLEQAATDNCHFHGRVTMDEHWQDIGFLVISSRYEGLPLVALEAMARGIVVISFAVGDIAKLITHDIDGYVIEQGNMEELDRSLKAATQAHPKATEYLRQNAALRVKHFYSTDAILPQYIDLYQGVSTVSLHKERRVLIVHYGEEWLRGSEIYLLQLVRHLKESHWTPIVWCNAKVLADALEGLAVTVIRSHFTMLAGWQEPRFNLSNYRQLTRQAKHIIANNRIDVVHTNNGAPNQWMIPAAKKAGIPVVCQLHSLYQFRDRVSLLLNEADALVGVSNAVIAPFLMQETSRHKTQVIHNGICLAQKATNPESIKSSLNLDDNTVTLISVGSLIQRKGFDLLIQAVALVSNNVHLIVVGDGPELAHLQQLCLQLEVAKRVHFLGERQDVAQLLRAGHTAFVSGAREEAFGLVLAEAGLAHLPVIAPNVDGIPEVLDHGRAGILVPPNNAAALAKAITELVGSSDLQHHYAEALYQRVQQHFDSQTNAQKLCDTYDNIISARHKPAFLSQPLIELHFFSRAVAAVIFKLFTRTRAPR